MKKKKNKIVNIDRFPFHLYVNITSLEPGISLKWDRRALCGQMIESVSESVGRVRVDV